MAPKRKQGVSGVAATAPPGQKQHGGTGRGQGRKAKGRYESAMWRAAGLEEPGGERKAKGGLGQSSGELEGGEEVDNLGAGGFFGQYGREQHGLRPTVIPRYVPASPTSAHTTPDADDSSDE